MPISLSDSALWRANVRNRVYITDVDPDVIVASGTVRIVTGSLARAVASALADGAGVMLAGGTTVVGIGGLGAIGGQAVGGAQAVAMLTAATDGDMTIIITSGATARAVLESIAAMGGMAVGSSAWDVQLTGVAQGLARSFGSGFASAFLSGIAALGLSGYGATEARAILGGLGSIGAQGMGQSSAHAVATAGSGEFSPTDIAGLKLWLKADAITGLSDGDPVATWPDSSGQGVTVSQSTTSKRPTYRTGVINSLPTVRFDGSDDYLTAALSVADGSKTVFLVFADNSTDSSGRYFLDAETGRLIVVCRSFNAGTPPYNQLAWYDGTWRDIAALTSGWHHYCWRLDASGASGALFRDGTSLGSASYSSKAIGGNVAIGSAYDGGGAFIGGDIAEMLIYDTALSTTNRQSVETYLATKYGL